eukprot:PhF_6_TR19658/c1_g1_i1/m.28691/K08857/NEK1_4_5; NIMA (never in mitosis gene a)-related kinase 1/4/5
MQDSTAEIERPLLPPGIASRNYMITSQLSSSNTSKVYVVTIPQGTQQFVAKVINLKSMSAKDLRHIQSEIRCLAQCDHPHVIRYVEGGYIGQEQAYLIMEYAQGGDLRKQIKLRKSKSLKYSEQEVVILLTQIVLSLHHLHSMNILHRDIKPSNIFMTRTGITKLGDFGFCKQYDDSGPWGGTVCGTPSYISPEMWRGEVYSKSSDVWSLGVILFELLTFDRPFRGESMHLLSQEIISAELPSLESCGYSKTICDLCSKMLKKDPTQRPTTAEMLRMKDLQSAAQVIETFIAAA